MKRVSKQVLEQILEQILEQVSHLFMKLDREWAILQLTLPLHSKPVRTVHRWT